MLDICRSMSKAYVDLVVNFNSALTNLVLIRRDAYLHHTHPNLDGFRLHNQLQSQGVTCLIDLLCKSTNTISFCLGVKTGTKRSVSNPTRKRRAEVEINVTTPLPRVCSTNPCRHPNTLLPPSPTCTPKHTHLSLDHSPGVLRGA